LQKRLPTLRACWDVIEKSRTMLRGWDFPHIDQNAHENGDSWIGSYTKFMHLHECWRFYQSGQFIFLRRFKDDLFEHDVRERALFQGVLIPEDFEPSGYASIVEILYSTTEVFDFAAQLCQRLTSCEGMSIELQLNSVDRRVLYLDNSSMRTFYKFLRATTDQIIWCDQIDVNTLISSHDEVALAATGYILERFDWLDWANSEQFLKEEQKKLTKR
jgi:hypothetical protein